MSTKPRLELAVVGGPAQAGRLLKAGTGHPLRDCCLIHVGSRLYDPEVLHLADQCYLLPREARRFDRAMSRCGTVLIEGWALADPNHLAASPSLDRLTVLGQVSLASHEVVRLHRELFTDVVAADYIGFSPALDILPEILENAQAQYGELLLVSGRAYEQTGVDNPACLPGCTVSRPWLAGARRIANLLTWKAFPSISMRPLLGFAARHAGAPEGTETYAGILGMIDRLPWRFAQERRALVAIASGRGMPEDRTDITFVFEEGRLKCDYRRGLIWSSSGTAPERLEIAAARDGRLLMFDALLSGRRTAFQPALNCLQAIEFLEHACTALIQIPVEYRVGTSPLPAWPADGVLAVTAQHATWLWMRRVGFVQAPEIRHLGLRRLGLVE